LSSILGYEILIKRPYEQAVESTIAALKTQGFGILTRVDVKNTLKEKLGADFRPYVILGACNPPLAHKSLTLDPWIGLLLPCNVTVEETPGGESIVRLTNPDIMVELSTEKENPELQAVVKQASEKIQAVVNALKS
jgi:uncharacterized protein (DUF302 family)